MYMTNSKTLERVTGSAAVFSSSLPDVFWFLPALRKNGIGWKRAKTKAAIPSQMLMQHIPQVYHPLVARCTLGFSAFAVASRKFPDIFQESSEVLLTLGLW